MSHEQKHPILQKLEEYLKNTPKEQLDEDWLDILKNSDMEAYYEKKYKDALERAKKLQETCDSTAVVGWCEYLFPELKEDNDERIRKGLIKAVSRIFEGNKLFDTDVTREEALAWLEKKGEPEDKGEISDGYHTFNELYSYRMLYNAAFFNLLPKQLVHKSKRHHDGEECFGGGWFIVMANLPTGQISNHYELKDWDLFQIPEKEIADEWDGHTPQEAAERLHKYLLEKQGKQTADKVEPKFKVSDWLQYRYAEPFLVEEITEQGYCNGDSCLPFEWEDEIHLWSITDAKNGDLIYVSTEEKGIQAIFHEYNNDTIFFHCYLCGDFVQGGYMPIGSVELTYPLQKTHYNRFFEKMHEAGYEWDGEKKELKKMEVASKESEDEKIIRELCNDIDLYVPTPERYIAWLEKQGEQHPHVDVNKMVDKFAHTEVKGYGIPSMIEVDAYRRGIEDALKYCLTYMI